ncbi:alpha/beta fold hydrolase [Rhodobacterales bacterium HKCCE2091]|nr:alpha/beta fold hydrolase [Rhodobacterales bacterium HKCCE2091]
MLSVQEYGERGSAPPVLIAHGLFGSGRNLGVIAKRLSEARFVLTVDMRNHGTSPWFDSQSYFDMAGDLAEVIDEFGGQADVVGHSMGGKAAMVLALTRGALVRRLVVADIAPVAYSHSQNHLIAAMRSLDLARIGTRRDADEALSAAVEEPGVRAFLLQSLDIKEKKWCLNLDVLEAEMERIVGFPEVDGSFDGDTLFLAGAGSDYVKREYRTDIKRLFPKARFASLPGAGHWLHADKPREFEAALAAFLNR